MGSRLQNREVNWLLSKLLVRLCKLDVLYSSIQIACKIEDPKLIYIMQLSLQELRDAVVNIYENRKNLAATLTDTKNVVANLERVMTAVVQFVLFFAYLAIWKVR